MSEEFKNYYHEHYNPKDGRLFVFHYKGNKDAGLQLFISNNKRRIEFQNSDNRGRDVDDFLYDNKTSKELREWFISIGIKPFDGIVYRGNKYAYEKKGDMLIFDDVDLSHTGTMDIRKFVEKFPDGITEWEVRGAFHCDENRNLKNFIGGPRKVDYFSSTGNESLTSLEGCPERVEGDFFVGSYQWEHKNKVKNLKGCPKYVGGKFGAFAINLESCEGAPKHVGGDFDVSGNNLTSLKGLNVDDVVGKVIYKDNNIVGIPKELQKDKWADWEANESEEND